MSVANLADSILLSAVQCIRRPAATALLTLAAIAGLTAVADAAVAPQGGLARWSGLGARSCALGTTKYPAVGGVCYYPVDLHARVGRHAISLWDAKGKRHNAQLEVQQTTFPAVTLELPPALSRYIDVSPEDKARAGKESVEVSHALHGEPKPPQFTLPLGKPAATLPKSQDDFGSVRNFGAAHPSLHTGRDYPVSIHTPVKAMAAGRVVLAGDQFYSGGSVYIDHGDGLVTMYFHLETMVVKTGDVVRRGQTIGKVGATGRATGPHLHLGARWLGRRIDPALLLDAPAKLPSVADSDAVAEQKIETEANKEPPETDVGGEGDE